MTETARDLPGLSLRGEARDRITRTLPEETALALVYDGSTQAVMMGSPADLEDFAVGFSLSEHIVTDPAQIESVEIVPQEGGIELRMWLVDDAGQRLSARRRRMAGPVGCGLCGIDSLSEALRPIRPVAGDIGLDVADIDAAIGSLSGAQPLHDRTRAVHAAGFYVPGEGLLLAREDVGRHNALDKLLGAMARGGIDTGRGIVAITSRISVDMVQKCAVSGSVVLAAVSAPTAHAVRLADGAGLTLAALARGNGCEVFTHPHRIRTEFDVHVA